MAENIQRSTGRNPEYRFDRGNAPVEFGPYIGEVRNNVDPTRCGRLQVYIEEFAGENKDDPSLWRTVSYAPPFYGTTEHSGTSVGNGEFIGNKHTYGMWFTPPDIGTRVLCFFAAGDPNQGYYTGCVIEPGLNHMVPAIGSADKYEAGNSAQTELFDGIPLLPVTEINNEDPKIFEDPRFFALAKPIHTVVAGVMFQQGLIRDPVRGPINSSSQRESPSAVYGISTPGQPIYEGGLYGRDLVDKLEKDPNGTAVKPQDIKVVGRMGGHSLVMDDGDITNQDAHVRIRTSKGHQIMLSDSGDCIHIIHSNGQTWLEFGVEGTVDVFSTNSINLRTQGTINLHADENINFYAGNTISMVSKSVMNLESQDTMNITGTNGLLVYSTMDIGVRADGSLAMKSSKVGSWDGGNKMNLVADRINLNSGGAKNVEKTIPVPENKLDDTKFDPSRGWVVEPASLPTTVVRAPTHEPYPYHNLGVDVQVSLTESAPAAPSPAQAEKNAKLSREPVKQGINAGDFARQPATTLPVPGLDPAQVTGMASQAAKDVGQSSASVSASKGIGKFGFSTDQLEKQGLIKPGMVTTFLNNLPTPTPSPADIAESQQLVAQGQIITPEQVAQNKQLRSVLQSPTIWTGKMGVTDLSALLGDDRLQTTLKNTSMNTTLQSLKSNGVLQGNESPTNIASVLQNADKFGVGNTAEWLKGRAPADIASSMDSVAKSAQYAVSFVDTKILPQEKLLSSAQNVSNTVDRSAVDDTLAKLIGNPKIPVPKFGPKSSE